MKRENEGYKSFGQNFQNDGNYQNDEEDYSYEIETTQNNPIGKHCITTDSVNPTNPSYIEKLETKIRDQARRLSGLEKYKYLCEKRLKLINPSQTFPITEDMLTAQSTNTDIINQEETNNYIALLKQTIDSDLIKKGLLTKYINSEGIIELEKLRNETENYRKNLVLAQTMVNSLKSDVDELIKENGELKILLNNNMIHYQSNTTHNNNSNLTKTESGCVEELRLKRYQENNDRDQKKLMMTIEQLKEENARLNNQNKTFNEKQRDVSKMSDEQIDNVNKKLYEYKENYEKIHHDFELLLKEKTQLKQENNRVMDENKMSREYICSLEVEVDKIKSMLNNQRGNSINEDYKKMYDDLLIENANFKKMLTNTNNIKQFCPDLNTISSNRDTEKILNEHNNLQIENEKIKIDFQNLLNEKNNIDKENEYNKSKVKTLNIENVRLALDNEKLNKSLSQFNDHFNKEMEAKLSLIKQIKDEASKAKVQNDEHSRQNITISSNYDDIMKRYNDLQDKYNEMEHSLIEAKAKADFSNNKVIELQTNYNQMEKEHKKLKAQCTQYEKENCTIKSSENKLKQIVEMTENKVEETMSYNDVINNQLKKMENEIEEKNQLITQLKDDQNAINEELSEKMKMFDEYVLETKENIAKILGEIYTIAGEYDKLANQDLDSLFTKNFSQGITQIISQITSITNVSNYDLTLNDKLFFDTITKFYNLFTKELEAVYERVFDSNQCVKETNSRILTLEEEMRNKQEQMVNDSFNRLTQIEKQNNSLQIERQSLYSELSKVKDSYSSIEKTNEKLSQEIHDLMIQNDDLRIKLTKGDTKIIMLTKDKKAIMSLMQKLIKNFPYKDLAKTMLEMLNVSESLQKLELEEMNLEDKLRAIESEYKTLIKDSSYASSELCTIVTGEYNNIKRLISDFKQKILVKSDRMKQLNSDYERLEINYKKNIEPNAENYQKALKEIAQLKELINGNSCKQRSISSPRNVVIETTLKEGETNRLEINSIDSNIMLSGRYDKSNVNDHYYQSQNPNQYDNDKNNDPNFNSVEQGMLLTNYDEIEQEIVNKSRGNINFNSTNTSNTRTIKQS